MATTPALPQSHVFPHLAPTLLGVVHVAMMGSIYTTIAVALERAVTVCAPFTDLKVILSSVFCLQDKCKWCLLEI